MCNLPYEFDGMELPLLDAIGESVNEIEARKAKEKEEENGNRD